MKKTLHCIYQHSNPTTEEVFNTLKIKSSAIWSNLKGITKQAGGYIWKYKN
jgi:hypothetical protein